MQWRNSLVPSLLKSSKYLPNKVKFIYLVEFNKIMEAETICIPKKEYELLLEEVGILRNPKMSEAIDESDNAKAKGVKTWGLKI